MLERERYLEQLKAIIVYTTWDGIELVFEVSRKTLMEKPPKGISRSAQAHALAAYRSKQSAANGVLLAPDGNFR